MNFHVKDEIWIAVVPPKLRNEVVCLACFDAFALERDISLVDALDPKEVLFVGDKVGYTFGIEKVYESKPWYVHLF